MKIDTVQQDRNIYLLEFAKENELFFMNTK